MPPLADAPGPHLGNEPARQLADPVELRDAQLGRGKGGLDGFGLGPAMRGAEGGAER